jgi:hypothetical protein
MYEEVYERIDDGKYNLWIKCFLNICHTAIISLKLKYFRNVQDVRYAMDKLNIIDETSVLQRL